jgi:ActR/RegA family two-component response regulator
VGSATILVVDDEDTVRHTLHALLADAGYNVASVASGADALAILNSHEFDLVLTDLRLEDIDGLQILGAVQRRWPDTVTLMLTGYASLDSAVAALRAGAYDYLCKPCPVDEILATVARGLERRRLVLDLRRQVHNLEVSIDTSRDLHSSLHSNLESTSAVLRERNGLLGEVKTSLLGIVGLADMALVGSDAELPGRIEQVRNQAERLLHTIQAALDPHRVDIEDAALVVHVQTPARASDTVDVPA